MELHASTRVVFMRYQLCSWKLQAVNIKVCLFNIVLCRIHIYQLSALVISLHANFVIIKWQFMLFIYCPETLEDVVLFSSGHLSF